MVRGFEPKQVEDGSIVQLRHCGEPAEFPGELHEGEIPPAKGEDFNPSTSNTGDVGTAGKTFNNRQTLTGRTGAFKDRVTRELRRHTWNQINNQHEGKTRSQGAHGEQNHNKTVQGRDTTDIVTK